MPRISGSSGKPFPRTTGGAAGVIGASTPEGTTYNQANYKKRMGPEELGLLAKEGGCWSGPSLIVAIAVAMAESGGNSDAENFCCVGIWQINVLAHTQYTRQQMKDPKQNVRAACAIYRSAGNSWHPWESYTNGAYKKYMKAATAGSKGAATGEENLEGGLGAVVPGLDTLGEWGKELAKALHFLTTSSGWFRIAKVVGGFVLLMLALNQVIKLGTGQDPIATTKKIVSRIP